MLITLVAHSECRRCSARSPLARRQRPFLRPWRPVPVQVAARGRTTGALSTIAGAVTAVEPQHGSFSLSHPHVVLYCRTSRRGGGVLGSAQPVRRADAFVSPVLSAIETGPYQRVYLYLHCGAFETLAAGVEVGSHCPRRRPAQHQRARRRPQR